MYIRVCTCMHTVLVGALPSVGPHWKSNSSPRPHPAVPKNGSCGTGWPRSAPTLCVNSLHSESSPLWGSKISASRIPVLPSPKVLCAALGVACGSASTSVLCSGPRRHGTPCVCLLGCLSFGATHAPGGGASVWGPQAGSSVEPGVWGSSVSPPASSVLIVDKSKTRQSPRSQRVGMGPVLRGGPVASRKMAPLGKPGVTAHHPLVSSPTLVTRP
uniref:Uncharacterized protein n=1 Tax=Pipistrellus kuhlii TaxID=59472 RepID=A0A7J7S3Q3_PIPKU|nr:hypothetical protein mPipKuh1_010186 [Pipistrellus kuhlii]